MTLYLEISCSILQINFSCCRLPFAPPSVVARAPPVVYPLKTRHHDASHHNQRFHHNRSATEQTTSTITSLSQGRRPPLQPVCRRVNDLLYNQSATGQTTSSIISLLQSRRPLTTTGLRLSRYRQSDYRGPQTYRRRTAGVPQTMHCQGSYSRGQGKGAGPCYHQHVKYKVYRRIGVYTLYKTTS